MSEHNNSLYFLKGGGEMGRLTREKNWADNPLGDPTTWSQSLCTMVGVMLENPFAMCIVWGKNYIQLYNDAYRPILGSLKHPHALGNSAKETFAEIWNTIEPLLAAALDGNPAEFTDFMLLLNRHGFEEECYFDFSYTPIREEDGKVAGIMVTIVETTRKKKAALAVAESEIKFRTLADNIPNLAWMAEADGNIYWYNKKWYEYTGTKLEDMEGWGWQSVHDPTVLQAVLKEWKSSIEKGNPFEMVFPLKGKDGSFRSFLTRVLPIRNTDGFIYQWLGTNTDITLQKKAEDALKESEERFKNMAEDADILIAVADETSNAVYFNKAWVQFTGSTMENLLLLGWTDLIHKEDKQHFLDLYLTAFKNRKAWVGECRILNLYNQYRWVLAKGTTRFNVDGTFAGYISSCVDITELKQTQNALVSSEQRFKQFIMQSPTPMVIVRGSEHKIELSNIIVDKNWGNGDVDFSNKTIGDLFPGLKQHNHNILLDKVYTTRKSFREYELEVFIKENDKAITCYFDFEYAPLFENEKDVTGIIITINDVTAHVEARQKIEKNEQKFRLLADAMPQHIWTADAEGHLNYFNQSVFNFSGLTLAQINKDGWLQNVHPNERDENIRVWAEAISIGKDFVLEHRFKRYDGEYRWQLSRAIPQIDEYGKIQMWVGTSTDIQDQKNFTNELERQVTERTKQIAENNIELEKMNKELQSFAYISSHDLQEPLRKIQIFSSLIMDNEFENLSDNGKEKFVRMRNSANRMQSLIQDLLSYSRTGTAERIFEKCDLSEIIKDIKEEMQEEFLQKNAIVEIKGDSILTVITFQFRQLMYNLISNSLKFVQVNQAPHIIITCTTATDAATNNNSIDDASKHWHISFVDNGIGFEEQYNERIFEVFQRLHGKTEYEGTGIGLAIVKKIVENHAGIITAKGEINKGATFNIFIPKQIK